ncbi:MAG: acyl-CoA reductase [Rhodothermales bacterium]|nr:acyl-CoA reductase [Rhodothermales bacterium]
MSSPTEALAGRFGAVVRAARAWRDPAYPPRAEAVARTLEAPNRFTEEALAFAINQQMNLLRPRALQAWVDGRQASAPCTVGVLNAGNLPLVGLQDLLAVLLTGHRYYGAVSSKSPFLLPAFVEEVRRHDAALPARFAEVEGVFEEADAVIATGSDETRGWAEAACERHGIPPARRLLRGHRYAVAVIDGHETEDELEGLAEDVLLHEGLGCRNVALVFAPDGLAPDALLEALAHFRAVFPPHPETPGSLAMQKAFLAAVEQPHAHGDGLEFLVSKGVAEVQPPGHLRWTGYTDLEEVRAWLEARAEQLQLVVAREAVGRRLAAPVATVPPGDAQRPPLDWRPDGIDPVDFLAGLEGCR